jgi:hypothetical protein
VDRRPYFDPWWRAREGSSLKVFTQQILESLDYSRPGGVRGVERAERVEALIVALVREIVEGHRPLILVQMAKPFYSSKSTFDLHPVVQTEALIEVVKKLEKAEWVKRTPGRSRGNPPSWPTEIWATDRIIAFAQRIGVASQIVLAPNTGGTKPGSHQALILRGPKDPNTGRREDIPIPLSKEADGLRSEVEDLGDWYEALSERIKVAEGSLISTRQRRLKRIFHTENVEQPRFNLHGRLYGAFWINLPRADRHELRLDGEPVAVLDYGQSFLRIAYAEAKKEPPEGDLYDIPGLEDYDREAVKEFLNAMLNTGHRLKQFPEGLREQFDGLSAIKVGDLIREHHSEIAHVFPTIDRADDQGSGPRLTFIESEIMLQVLRSCRDNPLWSIPALPLHDGLMVPWSKRHKVGGFMWQAFERRFPGYSPLVTCSKPDNSVERLQKDLPRGQARDLARSNNTAIKLAKAIFIRAIEEKNSITSPERFPNVKIKRSIEPEHWVLKREGVDFRFGDPLCGDIVKRPEPEWMATLPKHPGPLPSHPEGRRYNRRTLGPHEERVARFERDNPPEEEMDRILKAANHDLLKPYLAFPVYHPKRISMSVDMLARHYGLDCGDKWSLIALARQPLDLDAL